MSFFEESTESSFVKRQIVTKYFDAWSKIIKKNPRVKKMGYIDLYSGPGRYKQSGELSTPLLILKKAIDDKDLSQKLITVFNDKDPSHARSLEKEIRQLPDIGKLKYQPVIINREVDEVLAKEFGEITMIPSFAFIDPWGYKGLSSELIQALIKDWGSDCIFFFNYNRINMGLNNDAVKQHIDALFGSERAELLRVRCKHLSPPEKEALILNELGESLSDNRQRYVLPFRFRDHKRNRTSHHLIFISKHPLGYGIMKEIMYNLSSEHFDGVASFEFIPTENRQLDLLFAYSMESIDNLCDALLIDFKGKTLTAEEIYLKHHIGKRFIWKNYQEALRRLESQNKIITFPKAEDRKMYKGVRTFPKHVTVTFP